ncbi:MAG: KH domain-containing protein [Verrucomicrobia bacterium]|nr:KH domain-containing protein [Verrucomicrobiota bacterium]
MEAVQEAHKILDSMLGKLGFELEIEEQESEEGTCLQITCEDSKFLIGRHGERLDDIQYLVNRILQKHDPDAPRVKVDADHYREQEEERIEEQARDLAEQAKESGKVMRMRPLNAYHRRIVHNALVDDEEVETSSPRGSDRLKRIEIRPRS